MPTPPEGSQRGSHVLGGPQNPVPIQASGDLGFGFKVLGIEGLSSNGKENGNYYITWSQGFRIRRRSKYVRNPYTLSSNLSYSHYNLLTPDPDR